MQTEFVGLTEEQAVEKALTLLGFSRVDGPNLFACDTEDAGAFTIPYTEASAFDRAARFFGQKYFDRDVLPIRRKRFLAFSQSMIECCGLWNDQQVSEDAASGT